MAHPRIPKRGEIWSYLPTITGHDKPSSLAGERILVISNTNANASLARVAGIPILTSDVDLPVAGHTHTITFAEDDPLPGCSVIVYRFKVIYRQWLTDEPLGTLSTPTMRQVFAALVGYLDGE